MKPTELSEIIPISRSIQGGRAPSVAAVAKEVFSQQGIASGKLPFGSHELLLLDENAEKQSVGNAAPGRVNYKNHVFSGDLW
jgi:hypothetical protein